MRQAGILAACGIVSLTKMTVRLSEDHARAKRTAAGLRSIPGLHIPEVVETNILMVDTDAEASDWVAAIREQGVWAMAFSAHRIRLVFHYDVDDDGVDRAIAAFRAAAERLAPVRAG